MLVFVINHCISFLMDLVSGGLRTLILKPSHVSSVPRSHDIFVKS